MSISINVTPAASGGTFTVGSTSLQNVTLEVTGGIGPPGTDVALAAGNGISIVTVNNTATISSTLVIPDNLSDLFDVTLGNVTTGQVLAYNGTAWTAAADNALTLSTSAGSDLGTSAIGTSGEAARADHVHNLPTFAEVTNGTATVTGNLTLNASTGSVTFNGGTAGSASLTLNCEQNTHGVTIQGPPHSAAATYTLTLPTSDGAANQVLATDGSGVLSWADQSAGGVTWATEPAASNSSGTAGQIAYGSGFFYLHDGTEWRRAALSTFGVSTPTITITTQPQDLTLANGGSGNFTIGATVSDGSTPTYEWQNSDDSGSTWDTLTGSTGTTYSLSGVSTLDNGTQYRAIVSAAGASDVTSSVATLTVTAAAATYDLLAENGDRLMTEAGDSLDHDGTGGGGSGSTWTQVGSDIQSSTNAAYFGYSVDISGDGTVFAAGAYGTNLVRAYTISGSSVSQRGSDITASGAGDHFGEALSLSDDGAVIAISSPLEDGNGYTDAGGVRVFTWSGSAWSQLGSTIYGQDSFNDAGRSVSLSSTGSVVAIGAPSADVVRVYSWSGSSWNMLGAAISGTSATEFGCSVSLSSDGTRLAVGAKDDSTGGAGAGMARVYEYSGGAWSQIGSDINGTAGDSLGASVTLDADGDALAIGAPGDGSTVPGTVLVRQWTGAAWVPYGSDIVGDENGYKFGFSVRLNSTGNGLVVGIPGYYVPGTPGNRGGFKYYQFESSQWNNVGEVLVGSTDGGDFGHSVAVSNAGSRIVSGAPYWDGASSNNGYVRIYEWV